MKKDEIIQYWMAGGFLEPSKEGNTLMEDIGNTYFNILLATSFFQNATKDACGDIISCKMHDLMHDFAISISKSKILILERDSLDDVSKVQHLFVRSDGETTSRTSFGEDGFIKMRTLISKNLNFDDMLSNFKRLCVLKLSGHSIIGLPNSIEQLIHLRFLHISHTDIAEIPKSITKLYNLQTLRIEECPLLAELPEDLSNLINLRHISIGFSCLMYGYKDCLLKNMERLTYLQTLAVFCVRQDEGYRIKEMGPLKNLRGEIEIYNLNEVTDEEEAKSAKLKEKEIFKLGLYWSYEEDYRDQHEKVLEGLHPHPNLKSLTIECYGGKKFPSWVNDLSLFHNLIHIKLNSCKACEEVPTLGHLLCLRVLEILEMVRVRSVGSEFYGRYRNTTTLFPALRILKLEKMHNLKEWKDAKELTSAGEVVLVFPCLEELIISGCNKLRDLPYSLYTCVSLQNFVVEDCLELRSLPGVSSVIQHLEIRWCGIDKLPSGLQFCTSLQYLKIEHCLNLKSTTDLGEVFHSFIHLKISNYPKLELRREGRLKTLVIGGFIEELDAFPILRSPSIRYSHASLKKLRLHGSRALDSFPTEIQLFTAVEELQIHDFKGMEALPDWLSNLSCLQKLALYYCKELMYLPILRLTNLKHLYICDCRNLEDRCTEGSGTEWRQIAHIPNIIIDGIYIRRKDSEDFDNFDDDWGDRQFTSCRPFAKVLDS